MSSPREFMDCRYCNETTGHTRTAGCIIAVERAAAVNEVPLDFGPIIAQAAENDAQRTRYEVIKVEDHQQLARDVIQMALVGGMPDSYWLHDSRISRACAVLGITPEEARDMEFDNDD